MKASPVYICFKVLTESFENILMEIRLNYHHELQPSGFMRPKTHPVSEEPRWTRQLKATEFNAIRPKSVMQTGKLIHRGHSKRLVVRPKEENFTRKK